MIILMVKNIRIEYFYHSILYEKYIKFHNKFFIVEEECKEKK